MGRFRRLPVSAVVIALVAATPVGLWVVSPGLVLTTVHAVTPLGCLPPEYAVSSIGPPVILPPSTGPAVAPTNGSVWEGPHVVSTSIELRNLSIALTGGDLIVAAGGSLLLDNVSLTIAQVNGSGPAPLSFGVIVVRGGALTAKYSSIRSADGPVYPGFVVLGGTGRFLHVDFSDLGGTATSPVSGREGVLVRAGGVQFEADVFDHTYQVLFDGPGAVGDRVDGSAWIDSTIAGGSVGWVQVSDGASWTNLTHDGWYGCDDAGMLVLIEGPHVTLADSSLQGDPNSAESEQVYLTYNGSTDGGTDASWSTVVDDRFQTANLGISDGAHFTIDRNWFNDSGHWHSTGGAAAILVATWIGSGVGQVTRDVAIEQNVIVNFTHYAIRVSQNVSGFNVSGNRIHDTRSTDSGAIDTANGIYLIRGVNNGTVWNNSLDMTDLTQPSDPANGVILEAQVNDVNVSLNHIFNCSEAGITVQGDSGALPAPSYDLGPSSRNTLYGNWVQNFHSMAAQSTYSTEAIETWMWANETRILDNVVSGWTEVSPSNYWNGAGIFTSSSGQLIEGNRMSGVRFGFVFQQFDNGQELPKLGSFNRSYNLLIGNELSAVGMDSLVENADDGMGPIVNFLSGAVDPQWNFSFSDPSATIQIVNGAMIGFGPSSPYWAANFEFAGTLTLEGPGAAFTLPLDRWVTVPAQILFANVRATVPAGAIAWNITVGDSTNASGAVSWSLFQSSEASDTLEFDALVPGHPYGLSVDGVVVQAMNATQQGVVSFQWSGSGTHLFALVPMASEPASAVEGLAGGPTRPRCRQDFAIPQRGRRGGGRALRVPAAA